MGENKRVYTVEEIQAILSIGKNTAYALVKSGVFHSVKVGGQYRISKKDIEGRKAYCLYYTQRKAQKESYVGFAYVQEGA